LGREGQDLLGRRSLTLIELVWRCAALSLAVLAISVVHVGGAVKASSTLEERKLPMHFVWHEPSLDCQAGCRGWVSAVGVIDSDSLKLFNDLAAAHDVNGTTVLLDSGGGSVLDAIALGTRWRALKILTGVGTAVEIPVGGGKPGHTEIMPTAYCESMCVFLLLSGVQRYVPEEARVRVHQIWMGDRAEDARAATYNAEDVTIIERDVGRLAHYTFDMGGSGELLGIALSVPPWDALRQLSTEELWRTHLVTTGQLSDVLPGRQEIMPQVAGVKPFQDRVAPDNRRTAEVKVPTGGNAVAGGK
jgi:hypothetical protein